MSAEHIGYKLAGEHYYVRKNSAPTLLFSLARTLAKLEDRGCQTDAVTVYQSSDGDWVAVALYYDPNTPKLAVP